MTQKDSSENTRREAILAAALPLFLENGYEKTSIRMISQKVGCEVGLVYYYFSTKDDVFENALNLYFANQQNAFADITEKAKNDTSLFFDMLFSYLEKEASVFTETFSEKVHWTVRMAVRAKLAELLKPYLEEAVTALANSSRMPYSEKSTANTIADILINAIFHDEKSYFPAHKDDIRRIINHIIGMDNKSSGRKRDIPSFLL